MGDMMIVPVVIDSREQHPFAFRNYPAQIVQGALTSGDYSVQGFEDQIAIERKSLSDLIGCLTHDRDRFKREMERLRSYESAVIVVEAPWKALEAGAYRSSLSANSAVQSVISLTQMYRIPFFFAEDRAKAEQFAFDFLRHFCRHQQQRFHAVSRWVDVKR